MHETELGKMFRDKKGGRTEGAAVLSKRAVRAVAWVVAVVAVGIALGACRDDPPLDASAAMDAADGR